MCSEYLPLLVLKETVESNQGTRRFEDIPGLSTLCGGAGQRRVGTFIAARWLQLKT